MDNIGDLEESFYENLCEHGGTIFSVAMRNSGKTYTMNSFLIRALLEKKFEYYHFVCPQYEGEENDSFDFIRQQKHIQIYKSYNRKISEIVKKDRMKGKTLFFIDDGTNQLMGNSDDILTELITTSRHFEGLVIWCAVHACKKVIDTVVRGSIDYLFLYRISNAKMLEGIWMEHLSMVEAFPKFNIFRSFYINATKEKHSGLLLSVHEALLDPNVKNWNMNAHQKEMKQLLKPTQPIKKPQPKKENTNNNNVRKIGGFKIGKFFIR